MKPRCPKCKTGLMVPGYYRPGDDRASEIKCLTCGERVFRDFVVRRPTKVERDAGLKGQVGLCHVRDKKI